MTTSSKLAQQKRHGLPIKTTWLASAVILLVAILSPAIVSANASQPPKPQPIHAPTFRWWTPEDPIPLMKIERFWEIVEAARSAAESEEALRASLQSQLEPLSDSDLNGFQLQYFKLVNDASKMRLWSAIYLLNNGCGDSSFSYFCDGLVMKGKAEYEKVVHDPERLLDWDLGNEGVTIQEEHFGEVASELYEARHAKEEQEAKRIFPVFWKYQKPTDPSVEENDSEAIQKAYPRIWKYLQKPKP